MQGNILSNPYPFLKQAEIDCLISKFGMVIVTAQVTQPDIF